MRASPTTGKVQILMLTTLTVSLGTLSINMNYLMTIELEVETIKRKVLYLK